MPLASGLRDKPCNQILAAAVLSLALKFNLTDVPQAEVQRIWHRMAGKSNEAKVRQVEHTIFEAWAASDVPGHFASERIRDLTTSC